VPGIASEAAELALRARTVLASSPMPGTSSATACATESPWKTRSAPDAFGLEPPLRFPDAWGVFLERRSAPYAFRVELPLPFRDCVRGSSSVEARTVRAKRVPQPRKEYPVRVPRRERRG